MLQFKPVILEKKKQILCFKKMAMLENKKDRFQEFAMMKLKKI